MSRHESIPHLLTLFPHEAMDGFPYPAQFDNVADISPDVATILAKPGAALAGKIEIMRDMDHMYKHAIRDSATPHIAYYNILQHHLNMALALIDAATALNPKPDSPEHITNNEGYFKRAQDKIMNHLQLTFHQAAQHHDPEKASKELAGFGTGILGLQEWLSEVVAAHTHQHNDFHHDTATLYGAAYRFLSEAQEHMQRWQQELEKMPPAPPSPDHTPAVQPKFDVPMPVMSLFPKLHPCVYGQSPHELPEIVRFHTEVPSPAIEEQMKALQRLDEGHIRSINDSPSLDETYYHIMRHHLIMAYHMVHLAALRTPKGSPEWGLFESNHFNDSQDHCNAQIDQLFAAADTLRGHIGQEQHLRGTYGIARPNLAKTSDERVISDHAFATLQTGLEGKIRDVMESLYDPTTGEVREGFKEKSADILRTALDFLLDAREHLANWQYSLDIKPVEIKRSGGARGA